MGPKVAGIFEGAQSRASAPVFSGSRPPPPGIERPGDHSFEPILSRIKVNDEPQRPKYILAAMEKAGERRALSDVLKARRIEREVAKLEQRDGPFIHFDTTTNTGDFNADHSIEAGTAAPEIGGGAHIEFDFEGMRRRYLERLDATEILKLRASPAELKLIVNWVDLVGSKGEAVPD
jgi:hypothetical protein